MKSDANTKGIVAALRKVGASVYYLDPGGLATGAGLPDLLVGFRGKTVLMEVKRPPGPRGGKSGRELRESQVAFAQQWRGGARFVVTSVIEALHAIGLEPEGFDEWADVQRKAL